MQRSPAPACRTELERINSSSCHRHCLYREAILAAGRTDADGHYALDRPVPAGEVYAVVVTADGYPKTANNSGLDLRTVTEEDFDLFVMAQVWSGSVDDQGSTGDDRFI